MIHVKRCDIRMADERTLLIESTYTLLSNGCVEPHHCDRHDGCVIIYEDTCPLCDSLAWFKTAIRAVVEIKKETT